MRLNQTLKHNKYGVGKVTTITKTGFSVRFKDVQKDFSMEALKTSFKDPMEYEMTLNEQIKKRFKGTNVLSKSVGYIGKLFEETRIYYCIRFNIDLHDNTSRVFFGMKKNCYSWNMPDFTKPFEILSNTGGVFVRVPSAMETKYLLDDKSMSYAIIKAYSTSKDVSLPDFFYRKETIEDSNHFKGRRSCKRQAESIGIRSEYVKDIKGKTVYLIDDYLNTGSSLIACKKILLDLGAKEVIPFAVARLRMGNL